MSYDSIARSFRDAFEILEIPTSLESDPNTETFGRYVCSQVLPNRSHAKTHWQDFISNIVQIGGFSPENLQFNWRERPHRGNANWELHYFGLSFLPGYVRGSNWQSDVCQHAVAIVLSLEKAYRTAERFPKLYWNDHTIALRVAVLSDIVSGIGARKFVVSDDIREQLLTWLIFQSELVMVDGIFRERHNHGFLQAIALFYASLVLSKYPRASTWKNFSLRKIKKYIVGSFTSEGLHKEHSSNYHWFMIRKIESFLDAVDKFVDESLLHEFRSALDLAKEAGRIFVKSDGNLFPIGDTRWKQRTPLKPNDNVGFHVHPQSGYGLIKFGDNCSLLATNAYFSMVHKHWDNLGIHLEGYGTDWIVDAGMAAYGKSWGRQFCKSFEAHSTILVPGAALAEKEPSDAVSTQLCKEPKLKLSMSHRLWQNCEASRDIEFENNRIMITDHIVAKAVKEFYIIWHIPPDKKVWIEGNRVEIVSEAQEMKLTMCTEVCVGSVAIETWSGVHNESQTAGWYFPNLEAEACTSIYFRFKGTQLSPVVTSLQFERFQASLS